MSSFAVTVREIESVIPHPGADALDVCRVRDLDYQFVYAKDVLHPGDLVIYFPIDCVINSPDLIEKMGLTGRLSGSQQNRVKTITLRQQISQGVIIPFGKIFTEKLPHGFDVTDKLPVEKYIPPENPCQCGNLVGLPDGISSYDIEGCDNHPDVVELMKDKEVCITEKLEGSNYSVTYTVAEDLVQVSQHNNSIVEIQVDGKENTFWKVSRQQGLIDLAVKYCREFECKTVTIFGEMLGEGYQGNIYKLKGHAVRLYDVKQDWKWVDAAVKFSRLEKAGAIPSRDFVPILAFDIKLRHWLCGMGIKEASHAVSRMRGGLREGIVITPMHEQFHPKLGRLILKQRDPIYLAKSKES